MDKPGFSWATPILCVDDLPASLEYYQAAMGFELSWQWSESAAFDEPVHPTFACVSRGEISIFLCEKGQGNPGTWMSLNVDNREALDAMYAEYQQNQARIIEKPQDYAWGMCEMIVEDIDGNTFRIGCPLDASPK